MSANALRTYRKNQKKLKGYEVPSLREGKNQAGYGQGYGPVEFLPFRKEKGEKI